MAEEPITIALIADAHLDPSKPESLQRFSALRKALEAERPTLIVALGDITAEGVIHPEQLQAAKEQHDMLPAPVLALPGNHDIGNKVSQLQHVVTSQTVERWKQVFASDRVSLDQGNWRLIGINSVLAGSGLPAEGEQLAWLDAQLDGAEKDGRHAAIFMHEPPYVKHPQERFGDKSDYWSMDRDSRQRYLQRFARKPVRLIANGHTHWFQATKLGPAMWLWCPPIQRIVDDARFPRGGDAVGYIRLTLGKDRVQYDLRPLNMPPRTLYFSQPVVELPGKPATMLSEVVLDFTGTLSKDGVLIPSVARRLAQLSTRSRISVLTADTFGSADRELAKLPVEKRAIKTGTDKLTYVRRIGAHHTVAIGNGRNDVGMVREAAIGIAVVGPEGAAGDLVRVADVVVRSIDDALDLVLNPLRLKATLRD